MTLGSIAPSGGSGKYESTIHLRPLSVVSKVSCGSFSNQIKDSVSFKKK